MVFNRIITSKEYRFSFLFITLFLVSRVLGHYGYNPLRPLYFAAAAIALLVIIYLMNSAEFQNRKAFFKSTLFEHWFLIVGLISGIWLLMLSFMPPPI